MNPLDPPSPSIGEGAGGGEEVLRSELPLPRQRMWGAEFLIPNNRFVQLPQAGVSDWDGNRRVRSLNAPFKGVIGDHSH